MTWCRIALALWAFGPEAHALEGRRPLPEAAVGSPDGIAYGPYRAGQRPGGPLPTRAQIEEDLRLLAPHFGRIRVYGAGAPTDTILEVVATEGLPLEVMVGAWIAPGAPVANAAEVAAAIALANRYPEQVVAVSVGNETQVDWSAHKTDRDVLLAALREVRAAVAQPVTTADDHMFWRTEASKPVAAEIDFLCLHAYAMWNGQSLEQAVPWTAATYAAVQAVHPELPVALCELGWATGMNPEGDEAKHVKGAPGVAQQQAFHEGLTAWAKAEGVPYFWFEAFDEPWKGSDDPREIEKHWGLYDVARQRKTSGGAK